MKRANSLHTLTAAILAGGLGTRLRPVVMDRPKILAEVGGSPFLACLLDRLTDCGIEEIVLCTGYLGEQVEARFGRGYGNARLVYSLEDKPLGTGGALGYARSHFKSYPVLVLNGDSYCGADLASMYEWHLRQGAEASILLTEVEDTSRFGSVQVNEKGTVLRFDEKRKGAGQGWINAGIYLLGESILTSIPNGISSSIERDIFPAWIGRGLFGYRSKAPFLDIGTPESYGAAEAFMQSLARPVT